MLTVKSGLDPHRLEFSKKMSSFKRGARMHVGGHIGTLDKTRLPTPTPSSPPPQEWEDLNDTNEEDPEELVPDSSDEEQSEEPDAQPEVPPTVLEDQAVAQGQDGRQAQQQQNKDEDRWNESVHRWFDYPLPFPRMLREALVRLRLGHAWVTVGHDCTDQRFGRVWSASGIALSYAPALRHNHEAAISDAAQEALATLCYSCHSLLADGTLRYLPRHQPGGLDTWIVTPAAVKNPRLEATIDYLVVLNTDYNALAEELRTAKLEISKLRAQITPSMPLFNPVYYPPRKRRRSWRRRASKSTAADDYGAADHEPDPSNTSSRSSRGGHALGATATTPPPPPQPRDRRADFLKGHPPVFTHSADPIDAEDWLRAIERELDLRGAAQQWWESYRLAHNNPNTITWQEFTERFRVHHVPAGVMSLKKKEFLALTQGAMSLSRYCLEEVNTDPTKQYRFLKGLVDPLRYQLMNRTFPNG
ncbi:hypothetical protein U9M48_027150 [Paspalum notatum var. saurae]|uniref:Retrotransposon gag domain-containing protein n=1 Tax=Paspalum notatum var. saurae TaxID=547442 RepID=A0AAQ3WZN9_PASNO